MLAGRQAGDVDRDLDDLAGALRPLGERGGAGDSLALDVGRGGHGALALRRRNGAGERDGSRRSEQSRCHAFPPLSTDRFDRPIDRL
jgi:hypothetical protein